MDLLRFLSSAAVISVFNLALTPASLAQNIIPSSNKAYAQEIYEHDGLVVITEYKKYKFFFVPQTWNDAKQICASRYAHLGIINGQGEEQFFVNNMFKVQSRIFGGSNNVETWVGVYKSPINSAWYTVKDVPLSDPGTYVNWAFIRYPDNLDYRVKQPDNHYPPENCASLVFSNYLELPGMNDARCGLKFAFVCEKIRPQYDYFANF